VVALPLGGISAVLGHDGNRTRRRRIAVSVTKGISMSDSPAESRLMEIRKQQAYVDECFAAMENRKAELKAAKEQWELAVDALGTIIKSNCPKLPMGE
jgi:hypothetical protein